METPLSVIHNMTPSFLNNQLNIFLDTDMHTKFNFMELCYILIRKLYF